MKLSVTLLLCVLIHHGLSAPPRAIKLESPGPPQSFISPSVYAQLSQPAANQQEPPAHQHPLHPRTLPPIPGIHPTHQLHPLTLPPIPGIHPTRQLHPLTLPPIPGIHPTHQLHPLAGPRQHSLQDRSFQQIPLQGYRGSSRQEQHHVQNPPLQLPPPQGNHGPFDPQNHPGPERASLQRNHGPGLEHQVAPLQMNLGSGPSQHQSAGGEPAGEAYVRNDDFDRFSCGHKDCLNKKRRFHSSKGYGQHVIKKHTTPIDGDYFKCKLCPSQRTDLKLKKDSIRMHMRNQHRGEIRKVDHRPSQNRDRDERV